MPPWRRVLIALGLAWLVFIVPSASAGRWGDARSESPLADREASDEGASGDGTGDEQSKGEGSFASKVEIRAETDFRLYQLGDEITLSLELKTLEPLPADQPLRAALVIDGSARIKLPLEWTLPTEAGSRLEARWPLKEKLEEIGRYERGLMTLEAYVYPAIPREDLAGPAAANRLLIQISENQERLKSPRPQSADKKKSQEKKPKQEEKKPERPDRPPEKKQKPEDRKAGNEGPGEKPPADIDTVEHVIEPLFSGDETSKRKTRVFDRDVEDAQNLPPEKRRRTRDRAYQRGEEVLIDRARLEARERSLIRRYLDAIRRGGAEKR